MPQVYPPAPLVPNALSTLPPLDLPARPASIVQSLVIETQVSQPGQAVTPRPQLPLRRAAALPRRTEPAVTNATDNAKKPNTLGTQEALNAWRDSAAGQAGEAIARLRRALNSDATFLDLSNLDLSTLPPCLEQLKHLEKLDISNNKLVGLPAEIGQLTNLKEIRAQKNNLVSLPGSITKLIGLQRLLLEDNHLSSLPNIGLNHMVALRELRINHNRFSVLPDEIAQLPGLLELNVANNQLTRLPKKLISRPKPMLIYCHTNSMQDNQRAQYQRMTRDGRTAHCLYVASELKRMRARTLEPATTDPISTLTPEKKLQLLLEAASELTSREDTDCQSVYFGERHLTRKDCLAMALETALVRQPSLVPVVSHHLVYDLPDAIDNFTVFGTNLKRTQVADWAESKNLPAGEKNDFLASELMTRSTWGSQNVHRPATINFNIRQLQRIRERVPASKSTAKTAAEIDAHLKTSNAPMAAKSGFKKLMERTGAIDDYSISPASAMAVLWAYISATESVPLKDNLLDSMKNKFIEIDGYICAVGMLGRIIDIPTAIDWSVTNDISVEQLRTEMMQLAAETNEEFEAAYGDQTAFFNAGHAKGAPRPPDLSRKTFRANVVKAPENMVECAPLLLKAMQSGRGIFQVVSERKQVEPESRNNSKNILELISEVDVLSESGRFGNDYLIESCDHLTTDRRSHSHAQLVLRESQVGTRHAVPITQIGLRYKDGVLRAQHIEHAEAVMASARKLPIPAGVESTAVTESPFIIGTTGELNGRAGTLYAYTEIKRAITEGAIVDEPGLDTALAKLKEAYGRHKPATISVLDQQIVELKTCLLARLAETIGSNNDADSIELATSDIKREMFAQKAYVQLVILRGIDADLVTAETNRIFPPGVVI